MKENEFQARLIKKIYSLLPGCYVIKQDPSYIQGLPDLIVLYKDKWAALECKKTVSSSHRPNQDFYIQKMDEMSFARFIFPENEDSVIDEMMLFFASYYI